MPKPVKRKYPRTFNVGFKIIGSGFNEVKAIANVVCIDMIRMLNQDTKFEWHYDYVECEVYEGDIWEVRFTLMRDRRK